ncbi:hypothetical protein ACFQ69_08315 [Streptomyces sp. NPDC056470]
MGFGRLIAVPHVDADVRGTHHQVMAGEVVVHDDGDVAVLRQRAQGCRSP